MTAPLMTYMSKLGSTGSGGLTHALWSVVYASAAAGDNIVVNAGFTVTMDVPTTPTYADIQVYGTIVADQTRDTELRFNSMTINNGGAYLAGTEAAPWPRGSFAHTITPSGARASDPSLADPQHAGLSSNRGVMVMPGGEISFVATVPSVNIVKLGATANVGASSLTVMSPVTLKAGDELEVGTSMYYQEGLSDAAVFTSFPFTFSEGGSRPPGYGQEVVTVASDVNSSTTIPISGSVVYNSNGGVVSSSPTLQFRHHGLIQYLVAPAHEDVAGTNLSYTNTAILAGDSFGTVNGTTITGTKVLAAIAAGAAKQVDNRSTVGLLTHPIKFGAPNDSDWTTHGYGAHLMVMGLSTKCRVQGVERYRVGQAGFLGRYPDHQHMRSYTPYGVAGSGTYLGDVDSTANYIKKSSTRWSANRGSTIHGTCGFTLLQNVYSRIDTHCVFLEDGSEERNIIDGNFVSGVGAIGYGKAAIKYHDYTADPSSHILNDSGPAGIWYTNPNNHLRNNIVAGAVVGLWNTFADAYYTCYNERGGARTGNGTIAFGHRSFANSGFFDSPQATTEVITLTAISSTTFTRSGSVTGAMSNVTVGSQASQGDSGAGTGTPAYTYTITAGGTPFVAGDKFIFDAKFFGGCFGLSRDVQLSVACPMFYTTPLEHSNNEAHSCVLWNMRSQPQVGDEFGFLGDIVHFAIGSRTSISDTSQFLIQGANLWKGGSGWYNNESDHPKYQGWTCAGLRMPNVFGNQAGLPMGITGNVNGTSGGGRPGVFDTCSMFTHTLDDAYTSHAPVQMVSYGGGIGLVNCIHVPKVATTITVDDAGANPHASQDGGVIRLWDFYVYPIFRGFTRYTGTCILGADPGWYGVRWPGLFMIASNFPAQGFSAAYSTACGTITNPWAQGNAAAWELPSDGSMFGQAGGWWVHDAPFLTYNTTGSVLAASPAGNNLNGRLVSSSYRYIGVQFERAGGTDIMGSGGRANAKAINYVRLQTDNATPVVNGMWNTGIPDAFTGYTVMRHAGILSNATSGTPVDVSWARIDVPLPVSLRFDVFGLVNSADSITLAIDWDHTVAVTQSKVDTFDGGSVLDTDYHVLASQASKAALLAATSCAFWIDSANDKLWVKVFGGDLQQSGDTFNTERKLLRMLGVTINNG